MEEIRLSRMGSNKEQEAAALHAQCHSHLSKLNQQLAADLAAQRAVRLNRELPALASLAQQIRRLQTTIDHQSTASQNTRQRDELLSAKQELIGRIQTHAKQIQCLKNWQAQLSISLDELSRESDQHQMRLQPEKRVDSRRMSGSEWAVVDGLWARMGSLTSEGLADALLLVTRQEKGSIKSVFRNYRTNDRMSELVRKPQIRSHLAQLPH